MYHHMIFEMQTVFICQLLPPIFLKSGKNHRGPLVFNKLLIQGFNYSGLESVVVKQLRQSIKMGILCHENIWPHESLILNMEQALPT